jgi:hypothetical protein
LCRYVVAWLEGTARAALQRETQSSLGGGGVGIGAGSSNNGGGGALGGHAAMFDDFAADECVWRATVGSRLVWLCCYTC